MQNKTKRGISCLLALVLALTLALPAAAADPLQAAADRAAACVCRLQPTPQNGSIGGEWGVLAMARGGYTVPDGYYEHYLTKLEETVRQKQGVLSTNKYTEYGRVVLALTALGKDPTQVAGYDLLAPLASVSGTGRQGVNGSIWALIALDSGDYVMPKAATEADQATRHTYVQNILSHQEASGGWRLGKAPEVDPDLTAMALQALAPYRDQAEVQEAVERGVACLASLQEAQGGFSSWDQVSLESTAQVIIALCRLGIYPEDSRFVKEGKTLLDTLCQSQNPDGSFNHAADGTGNHQMATEQALLALTAALRFRQGKTDLYDMTEKTPVQPDTDRMIQSVTVVTGVPDLLKQLMAQAKA